MLKFLTLLLVPVALAQTPNEQATALCRKARATGDISYYAKAGEVLRKSTDYDAQKLRVTILLGKQEFAEALKLATALNKRVPDDLAVWGLLAEANVGLGNYAEAEKDVQWMLDLRPGNVPGFIQAAGLRELFGDIDGAIEFIDEALRRTPQSDLEQQARLLTGKARLNLLAGTPARAGELLDRALKLMPDYYPALGVLAALRISEKKYDEAVTLLERRKGSYELAEALEKAGRKHDAEAAFGAIRSHGAG